jgi:hypothetical protein
LEQAEIHDKSLTPIVDAIKTKVSQILGRCTARRDYRELPQPGIQEVLHDQSSSKVQR